MKKEERLHRLMGDIDDGLVAEAARRPVRKMVWMPIVAAAACVALTVGLWQGGVFGSEKLPVEAPNEGTTTEVTDPTDTTKDTTTTTTAKPTTTTTTAKPTTTTTTKTTTKTTTPYILVGGEDEEDFDIDSFVPSLKDRFVSPALEAKMKEYRDVNAVYQVLVYRVPTIEDVEECDRLIKANKEYQSIEKQYEAARKALKEADKRFDDCEYPYADPRKAALWEERNEAEKKKREISNEMSKLRTELFFKYNEAIREKRIAYASKFCKRGPISGYGVRGYAYYMELTADAINELADRGGYKFLLATEKEDLSQGIDV